MGVGDPSCTACKTMATHLMKPCNHTSCIDHYMECPAEDEDTCGVCGGDVDRLTKVPQKEPFIANTPIVKRVHFGKSTIINDGPPLSMDSSGHATSRDGNGLLPATPNANSKTPTPTPASEGASKKTPDQSARYVPPALRNPPEGPVCPESILSPATFDSQLRIQANTLARVDYVATQGRGGLMTPVNRYLGNRNRAPTFDPFMDSPYASGRQSMQRSRNNTTGQFPSSSFPFLDDDNGSGSGGGNDITGIMSTPFAASIGNFTAPPLMHTPSNRSSAQDSAAANVFGNIVSNAANLATIIRSGLTDDPFDIDYGNPGRSKRLPPLVNKMPEMPLPRGKVAASDSAAMALYDTEPNTKGSTAAFQGTDNISLPPWFGQVGVGYHPTLEDVFTSLPVVDACRIAQPTTAGVIKITNVPYAVTRSELVAFVGRTAQIISQPEGSPYHAVHIMMDRTTGKTLDAYVELKNGKEASYVATQFTRRAQTGRISKIGDREVKVTVITQGDLMAELFPLARSLEWVGAVPEVNENPDQYYEGVASIGFRGFLLEEELTSMSKFAETPQRSPFVERHLIRPYEHLITVLHKYPWHAVRHVLLKERNAVFDTTLRSIRALMDLLRKTQNQPRREPSVPTSNTLQELVVAALTCPGFSEGQKCIVVRNLQQAGYGDLASPRGMNFRFGGTHKYASEWPFLALVKQPGVNDTMIQYFASLLREATDDTSNMSLVELHYMKRAFFGKLRIDYHNATDMAGMARAELRAIEDTLARILPRVASVTSYAPSLRS